MLIVPVQTIGKHGSNPSTHPQKEIQERRDTQVNSHTHTHTQMEYYAATSKSGFLFSGNGANLASLACLVTEG